MQINSSAFTNESKHFEGDRFINFRSTEENGMDDISQTYSTKIELFQIDHEMEAE